jgi:hypothetical protein
MNDLVTLEAVKEHLRITTDAEDDDLQRKILQASTVIVDYLKYPEGSADWNTTTCPPIVQAAVLFVVGDLYNQREGGGGVQYYASGNLPTYVTGLLYRLRDPAYA